MNRYILPKMLSEKVKQNGLSNEEMEEIMVGQNYAIIVYLHGVLIAVSETNFSFFQKLRLNNRNKILLSFPWKNKLEK